MKFAAPIPLAEAVAKINAKTPIGSVLKSAEWQAVPLALRERAQFSAGVESARVLQAIQDRMTGLLTLSNEQLAGGKTRTFDRSSFINDIRQIAIEEGLTPADPAKQGTLQDITSIPRLGMIFDIQQAQAQEYARWKMDQSEGALMLYPAQELLRIEGRKVPRDWLSRWVEAGGQFHDGRMVALKTDPIWSRLSRFGTPWPPFDFNSGMGLEDVDYDEAVALGLIRQDEDLKPAVEDFNQELKASTQGLSPEYKDILKTTFGDQIQLEADSVVWQSKRGLAYEQQRAEQQRTARRVYSEGQSAFRAIESPNRIGDLSGRILSTSESQWLSQISGVASGRKPLFHESIGPKAEQVRHDLQDKVPVGVNVLSDGENIFAYRPDVLRKSPDAILMGLDDGALLGYGCNWNDTTIARVNIRVIGPDKDEVLGFWAPAKGHQLFARARTQDFIDATGQPHEWKISGRKEAGQP